MERLELRVERLNVTLRFTFAFHARQVRFERDDGEGFAPLFPETFSFHPDRHDPSELSLQLDDLLRKPQLISPRAHLRDCQLGPQTKMWAVAKTQVRIWCAPNIKCLRLVKLMLIVIC